MIDKTSKDYTDGVAQGRISAGNMNATAVYSRRLSLNCPREHHAQVLDQILGISTYGVEKIDEFYRGVRDGLKQAEERARQAEVVQRIHAEEQTNAERRHNKPPCIDCGKRTVLKDRCRACRAKAKRAEYDARPDVIAKRAEQAKLAALGPTLCKSDLRERGWSQAQIVALGPPDHIEHYHVYGGGWREKHHYAIGRIDRAAA